MTIATDDDREQKREKKSVKKQHENEIKERLN